MTFAAIASACSAGASDEGADELEGTDDGSGGSVAAGSSGGATTGKGGAGSAGAGGAAKAGAAGAAGKPATGGSAGATGGSSGQGGKPGSAGSGSTGGSAAGGSPATGGSGGQGSSGPAGAAGSASSGGAGTAGSAGGSNPPPVPGGDAAGVTISEIAIYQGVKRPLMKGGQAATSSIPIVAGRAAMVRVFVKTDSAFKGGAVTGVLYVGSATYQATLTPPASSTDASLASTFNFDVPASAVTTDATFRVELKQTTSSTTNAGAHYPATGTVPLAAQSAGQKLRVVLVPIKYDADGSGRLPDTSASQLAVYRDSILKQYPIPEVEVTVRSQPVSWPSKVSASGGGWDTLLDAVTQTRAKDKPAADVYYYGIVTPASSMGTFCGGGCVAGLGGVGNVQVGSDSYGRAAIGLGFGGGGSAETAVHEIGHNHGRNHAPCGGAQGTDGSYPYAGASIGTWGYDLLSKKLLDPAKYTDFMGYCDPTWVSDYTYKALFTRLKAVNKADWYFPPEVLNLTYTRAIVRADGTHTWLPSLELETPPVGEPVTVTIQTASGTKTVTAAYYPHDHLASGVVVFQTPTEPIENVQLVAEGRPFLLPKTTID